MLFDSISDTDFISGSSQNFDSIYLIVIFLVLLLQLRRRRIKMWTLLIMPVFMLLFTIPLVEMELTGLWNVVFLAAGFIVGGGIGVLIGWMMEVNIDEKDGTMVLKGSLLAVAAWGAIIIIKLYGKDLIGSTGAIDIGLLTSVFLMVTLGSMIVRRAFVYWRYLQLKKPAIAADKSV